MSMACIWLRRAATAENWTAFKAVCVNPPRFLFFCRSLLHSLSPPLGCIDTHHVCECFSFSLCLFIFRHLSFASPIRSLSRPLSFLSLFFVCRAPVALSQAGKHEIGHTVVRVCVVCARGGGGGEGERDLRPSGTQEQTKTHTQTHTRTLQFLLGDDAAVLRFMLHAHSHRMGGDELTPAGGIPPYQLGSAQLEDRVALCCSLIIVYTKVWPCMLPSRTVDL